MLGKKFLKKPALKSNPHPPLGSFARIILHPKREKKRDSLLESSRNKNIQPNGSGPEIGAH